MKYYTIQNNNLLIANTQQALTRFYSDVHELPADYEAGKYVIGEVDKEIDVPDFDEEGNPIMIEVEETITVIDYDEEGNPTGEHEETITKTVQQTHKETISVPALVKDKNYNKKQKAKREEAFKQAFFSTSLGYIRRNVTMADGSHKDFLSDLLPVISLGVQAGQTVKIIAYDEPDYSKDVTDWTEYQKKETVTAQFIQECFSQLSNDFKPANEV